MSIFGTIKDAIFGQHGPLGGQFSGNKAPPAAAPAPTPAASHPQTTDAEPTSPPPQAPAAPVAPAAPAAPAAPVDVGASLAEIAKSNGQTGLNYKTSIVDLMKVLGMDSSLDNRKTLATELGYTGVLDGSAEMNIWLHKAVMRQLESDGAHVPADMKG